MKRLLIASFICSCVVNGYGMQQAQQAQHAWSTLTANQRFNQFVESGGTLDRTTWERMDTGMQYENMLALQKQRMQTFQHNNNNHAQPNNNNVHAVNAQPNNYAQPNNQSRTSRFLGFMKRCLTVPAKFAWNNRLTLTLITAVTACLLYNDYNGLGTLAKQYTPDKVQAVIDYCLNMLGLNMITSREQQQADYDNSWFGYRWTHSRPF